MRTEVIKIWTAGTEDGSSLWSFLLLPAGVKDPPDPGWAGQEGRWDAGAVGTAVTRAVLWNGDRDPLKAPGSMG